MDESVERKSTAGSEVVKSKSNSSQLTKQSSTVSSRSSSPPTHDLTGTVYHLFILN